MLVTCSLTKWSALTRCKRYHVHSWTEPAGASAGFPPRVFGFWFGFEADCPPKPLQTLGPGFSDDSLGGLGPTYKVSSLGAFAYLDNLHDYVHVTFC